MKKEGYVIYEHYDTNPKHRKYGNLIRKSRNVNLINAVRDYLKKIPMLINLLLQILILNYYLILMIF